MRVEFTAYTAQAGETCQCSGSDTHHCSKTPVALASDGEGHNLRVCEDPTHQAFAGSMFGEIKRAHEEHPKEPPKPWQRRTGA